MWTEPILQNMNFGLVYCCIGCLCPLFFEYYLMMSSLLESRCSSSICWSFLTFQSSNSTYIQFLEERLPNLIYMWSLQRPKEAYRGKKDISTAMDQGLNGSLAIDVWQYEQEKISWETQTKIGLTTMSFSLTTRVAGSEVVVDKLATDAFWTGTFARSRLSFEQHSWTSKVPLLQKVGKELCRSSMISLTKTVVSLENCYIDVGC